jgi:quercetin dioxygenase-like cupin family protein
MTGRTRHGKYKEESNDEGADRIMPGAATAAAQEAKVTPLMTQELAGIGGKEGTMAMVEYTPGGSDAAHRHNAYVFVSVLEGAAVMQVGRK